MSLPLSARSFHKKTLSQPKLISFHDTKKQQNSLINDKIEQKDRIFSSSTNISKGFTTSYPKVLNLQNSPNLLSRKSSATKHHKVKSLVSTYQNFFQTKELTKKLNDPVFKEMETIRFNNIRPKTSAPNIIINDFLGDKNTIESKKFRETIYYMKKLDIAKYFIKEMLNEYKKITKSSSIEEKNIYINNFSEVWGSSKPCFLKIIHILNIFVMKIPDRDTVTAFFNNILLETQNCRLYQLNLMITIIYAKCCEITRNYLKAILLYKQAKFITQNYSNFRLKLKCYKGLGRCFQILKKYSIAKHYFTKVLQLSWYLNDKKNELFAYDFIGLQYYYLGNMEQAQRFHLKMVKGEYEGLESPLRLLGISKFNKSSPKKGKQKIKNKETQSNKELFEDPMLIVSSSDEELDLTIPLEMEDLKKNKEKKKNFNEENKPKKTEIFRINPNNSQILFTQIKKKGNENIRYRELIQAEIDKLLANNKLKNQKHAVSSIFLQNNPIVNAKSLISHLTPNKSVQFFYNVSQNNKNNDYSEKIYNKLDGRSGFKLLSKLKILNSNLQFALKKLEIIINKLELNI